MLIEFLQLSFSVLNSIVKYDRVETIRYNKWYYFCEVEGFIVFKIGEFSKLTQVSIRMLRYYDEAGLLKPLKVDKFTGYRFYSTEQIPVLNKIKFFRDIGFNVSEIAVALSKSDKGFIESQLEKKQFEIENTIKEEEKRLSKIKMMKEDIYTEKISNYYNVIIKNIPSYQVLYLRKIVSDYYKEGELWRKIIAFADENNIAFSNNNFAIYHDDAYKETEVDIEVCLLVSRIEKETSDFRYRNTEPVPTMACTMVYGSFENIAGAYLSFANWLQEQKQYKTEIQIPLELLL